ncbi:MAG: ExbD/TolR family protein [bacterium]
MDESDLTDYEEENITALEITPLVAIALVLVIVFMVTAPLFLQPAMKIILPKAITGEAEEMENVTLSISQYGKWAVNEEELPLEKVHLLLSRKIEKTRDKYVIIRADQQALHKWLLEAMSISKECGAKTVSIKVERKQKR